MELELLAWVRLFCFDSDQIYPADMCLAKIMKAMGFFFFFSHITPTDFIGQVFDIIYREGNYPWFKWIQEQKSKKWGTHLYPSPLSGCSFFLSLFALLIQTLSFLFSNFPFHINLSRIGLRRPVQLNFQFSVRFRSKLFIVLTHKHALILLFPLQLQLHDQKIGSGVFGHSH